MLEYITDLFSNFWFFSLFILVNIYILWNSFHVLINILTSSANGKNKYVFITGCDSGFGHKSAIDLSSSKCKILAGCLTEDGVKRLRDDPAFKGTAFKMDVTKTEDIEKAKELVAEQTKEDGGLYALINNAGILSPGVIEWQSTEEMQRVMNINFWGTVNVTKAMLPFLKQRRGRIVNMSSMAGRVLLGYSTSYCVSKYAVEAFTDGLRYEMQPWGVSCHLVEPGMFKTDILKKSTITKIVLKNWNEQSDETKKEYGERFLNELTKRYDEVIDQIASPNIQKVISTINHAVLSSNPKSRYPVGFDAHTVWMAIATLPTYVGDLIQSIISPAIVPDAMLKSDKKN